MHPPPPLGLALPPRPQTLHRTNIPCPCTPAPHLLIPGTTSGPLMATHVCMTTSCNPYLGSALWPRPCSRPCPSALPALRPMTYALAPPLCMHDAHDVTHDHALRTTPPCITGITYDVPITMSLYDTMISSHAPQ